MILISLRIRRSSAKDMDLVVRLVSKSLWEFVGKVNSCWLDKNHQSMTEQDLVFKKWGITHWTYMIFLSSADVLSRTRRGILAKSRFNSAWSCTIWAFRKPAINNENNKAKSAQTKQQDLKIRLSGLKPIGHRFQISLLWIGRQKSRTCSVALVWIVSLSRFFNFASRSVMIQILVM